jgi:thioredoxin-related protein
MKKIVLLAAFCSMWISASFAQVSAENSKPYQKNPTLPAFNIRLMDSITIFNTYNIPKGRATMLILFSPDCSHCQAFFKKFLPSMDSFKNIDFYLVTLYSKMSALKKFYDYSHLEQYKNVKLAGRDYEYFCSTFYGVRNVPDLMLYDKHKKLVKLFDRPDKVDDIYEVTRGL